MADNGKSVSYKIIDDEPSSSDVSEVSKKKSSRGRRFVFWCIFTCAVFVISDIVLLLFFGKIWFVNPPKKVYRKMGVTVSSAQGDITWESIPMQNIDFVFIRATEGESLTDKKFSYNYDHAYEAGLIVSPMHDLTFSTDGKSQAEAFINTVGEKKDKQLPCTVRIRLYGKYVAVPPEKETVVKILTDFSNEVFEKYGAKPIIIIDEELYKKYIFGSFPDSKLCISSVYSKPDETDQNAVFWLFNPKTRINGCTGNDYLDKITILKSEEEYYDLIY